MAKLDDLIALAKSEEGYIEKASNANLDSKTANKGTNNYTKYSRDVNNSGLMGCHAQPWCATYQFWLEMKTFGKEQALKNWNMTSNSYVGYNCFSTYNKFKAVGKVGMTPKLGALVIFTFSHMGRVIDIYSRNGVKYYLCAEGNTSSNLNDRNGGQVKIKERKFYDTSTIKGYCYIDYDVIEEEQDKKSGWYQEDGGWRFYLGNTGNCIKNTWHLDDSNRWSWFDNNGFAVHDIWIHYKNLWYYFGSDCYMLESQWLEYKGEQYYLTAEGSMATNAYVQSKDPSKSNLYYWVNGDGIWEEQWDTTNPDLTKYIVVI